jgi:hypothetical protein
MKSILNEWLFEKNGQSFTVDLPHDAMRTEARDASCLNGVQSGYFPGGKYTYKKVIEIDESSLDQIIELFFEGVYRNVTVLVNGERAAFHAYGYTEFTVDISKRVTKGKNTVVVEVDNSLVPNCRWYSGAGLYRPVWLLIGEKEEPKIITKSYSPAVIKVTSADQIELYDGDTLLAKGGAGEYEIPNAILWNEETPYLYTCIANGHSIRFGIRKIEWSADTGLMINGKRTLLRGGSIHHDHGVLGACAYPEAEFRRVQVLKAQGFNALRMAHNPASRALLDACDELGMYVMDECFDGWYIPKDYHDYSRQFMDHFQEDLQSMVKKDFNHASVILYSIGNEVTETANEHGIALAGKMRDLLHALDITRPVTCGVNVLLNVYTKMGIGVYKDQGNYKPEPLLSFKRYKEKKTGSAFFNAMAGRLGKLMFFMSKGTLAEKITAKVALSVDITGLNYASSRYDPDVKKYPNRMMVGTETMVADLPYNWERVKKYPQLIGDFVWAAWDYLGEACIGDWTYHSYKGLPLLAGQGMIDITGKPLASMAFMRTVWGLRTKPFIAVSPLNHSGEMPSTGAWQFTNGIDSWTWQGNEGKTTTIEVYADAAKVRLELNGKVIGIKKIDQYRVVFKTKYQNGTLTAIALDEKGTELSRHSLETGGPETILTAKPESTVLKPKGLCFIPIEFTDRYGALKPSIEQPVTIKVEGTAKLLGLGSALCKTDERYDGETFTSYRGRLLAVAQATQKGNALVTITSENMLPVTIRLEVQ